MPARHIGLDEFKQAAKQGQVSDAAIIKSYACDEIKALDVEPGKEAEARIFEFVISTETPDRMGDAIAVDGWKLDAYRKNPVVLFAHRHDELPIAKAPAVWPENAALRSKVDFTESSEIYPFSRTIAQMVARKLLNAASVGFRPLVYSFNDARGLGAIDFLEQELLEFSIVPVPANAEALQSAKSFGIDVAPFAEWAERVLDGEKGSGLWVPKSLLTDDLVTRIRSIAKGEPASVSAPAQIEASTRESAGSGETHNLATAGSTPVPATTTAASPQVPSKGTAGAVDPPPVPTAPANTTKAGRVLSAANESSLRDAAGAIKTAADRIESVLSLVTQDEGKTIAPPSIADMIASRQASTVPDARAEMFTAVRSLLPDLLREIVVQETERSMAKAMGRVD